MSDIYIDSHKFNYDHATGCVSRISNGKPCNTERKRSGLTYYQTTVGYKSYLVHRIAFLKGYGYLPKKVDHINGISTDNRLVNLRDGDNGVNEQNRMLSVRSSTGVSGVLFRPKRNDYQVTISNKYIGYATNLFNAVCIRKSAENKLNFRGRK